MFFRFYFSLSQVHAHTHTGESDFMKFDKYTDTHMYMRASMASSFAQGKFKKERPQLTHAVESREQTVKVACINSNAHASHCTECWLLPHTHINVHGNKTNCCCCCCSFAAAAVSEKNTHTPKQQPNKQNNKQTNALAVMIQSLVHQRLPCYDFYFL